MHVNETIAIIGSRGIYGSVLAHKLAAAGHPVLLYDADKEEVHNLAKSINEINLNNNVEVLGCTVDACWEADVIILPAGSQTNSELLSGIVEVTTGKVIIALECSDADYEETGIGNKPRLEALSLVFPDSKIAVATLIKNKEKDLANIWQIESTEAYALLKAKELFNEAQFTYLAMEPIV